jgi:hypothetical protein
MADGFAVHLGGGAYLDASGNIVFGPPTGAQIYHVPDGFHFDFKKVSEVFKDLKGILPSSDEDKKKWKEWGAPDNIIGFLGKIAGAAGIVATAFSVFAWVIGVMIALMSLMQDGDGMSPELAQALLNIRDQLHGMEEIDRANNMIAMRSEFDGRADRMQNLLTLLTVESPVGAARANIFGQMRSIVDELAVPLSNLRDQEWATTYDPDSFKGRAFASPLLVLQNSDGTLASVPQDNQNVTIFDYRLGVPMLLYGATMFTALLQIAMPWFRSAGLYAAQLRKTAEAIDRFVMRMQNESLARTQYDANIVVQQQIWSIFEIPGTENPGPSQLPLSGPFNYAVGAFDLVNYSDAFLFKAFATRFAAIRTQDREDCSTITGGLPTLRPIWKVSPSRPMTRP